MILSLIGGNISILLHSFCTEGRNHFTLRTVLIDLLLDKKLELYLDSSYFIAECRHKNNVEARIGY